MDGLTPNGARQVLREMLRMADVGEPAEDVATVIARLGVRIAEPETAWAVMSDVLAANAAVADQIRSGRTQAVGHLVSEVLKRVEHDPGLIREFLLKRIVQGV